MILRIFAFFGNRFFFHWLICLCLPYQLTLVLFLRWLALCRLLFLGRVLQVHIQKFPTAGCLIQVHIERQDYLFVCKSESNCRVVAALFAQYMITGNYISTKLSYISKIKFTNFYFDYDIARKAQIIK